MPLRDDVAALEVVVAVDEDEEAAVVDVAEGVLGVGGVAGEAEPEDVDGDAFFDDAEVGGGYGRWRGGRRSRRRGRRRFRRGPLGVWAMTPVMRSVRVVRGGRWPRQPMRRVKLG